MVGKIYIITNDINNKVYIGQTVRSLHRRFICHCCNDNGKGKNMYIKRAILKYGKEHFQINLLEEVEESLLDEREIYWIKIYDSFHNGYNLTEGGNSNRNLLTSSLEDTINIYEFKTFIIENYPTAKEVEERFNICHSSVYNLIKRLGDDRLKLNSYNPRKPKTINDIDQQDLLNKYNEGWSIQDLVRFFKIRKNKISEYLKSLGITPRRGVRGYKHRI